MKELTHIFTDTSQVHCLSFQCFNHCSCTLQADWHLILGLVQMAEQITQVGMQLHLFPEAKQRVSLIPQVMFLSSIGSGPIGKNSCLRLMWNPRQDRSKQALSVSHGFPPLPLIARSDWSQPCRSERAAGLKYTQQAKNVLTGFPWSEENNCYLFAKLHTLVSLIQHFTEFHQNPPVTRELCQGCKLSLDVTHS